MQVLVVESQAAAAKSLELLLSAEGHTVTVTDSGEEACDLGRLYDYDAIFMAIDLDDMTGVQAIRSLRTRKIDAPVIVLADANVDARIEALSVGADDAIVRPFHKAELLARLQAVVRRARGHADSILRTGPIALNLATRQAEVSGQRLHLTPSEFKILELFSLRKNTALSKEQCMNHLYNGMSEPEPKVIDVFICKLRKKIAAANGGDAQIETVWGGGYMLRDQPAEQPRLAA